MDPDAAVEKGLLDLEALILSGTQHVHVWHVCTLRRSTCKVHPFPSQCPGFRKTCLWLVFQQILPVCRLLLLFVSNVLAHSDDPKYKRVKASNSRYQTAVGSKQGGPACMLALGFRLQRIDGQQVCLSPSASPSAAGGLQDPLPKHHRVPCPVLVPGLSGKIMLISAPAGFDSVTRAGLRVFETTKTITRRRPCCNRCKSYLKENHSGSSSNQRQSRLLWHLSGKFRIDASIGELLKFHSSS